MTDIDNEGAPEALAAPEAESPFGSDMPPMIEDEFGNLTALGEEQLDDEPEPETPQPEVVKIGDRELPIEEAMELLSKGEDYTKKTMALADERKTLEADAVAYRSLTQAWNDPNQRMQILAELQRQAGLEPSQSAVPTNQQPTVGLPDDWDDWVPNEQKLWKELQAAQQRERQRDEVLAQIRDHLQGVTQKDRMSLAARETASALTTKYGRTITAEEVQEAILETKVENPEAAWLFKNRDNLAAPKSGVAPTTVKPNTPSTRGRTFDPKDMDVDEIIRRRQRGEVPSTPK